MEEPDYGIPLLEVEFPKAARFLIQWIENRKGHIFLLDDGILFRAYGSSTWKKIK